MSRKLFALAMGALMVGAIGQIGSARADDAVVIQACGQEGCCRDRGCGHDGVCRAVTENRKKEKRCYTDICEQFCLPMCGSFLGGFLGRRGCGGDCDGGACHDGNCNQCAGPRTKKYLVVKIKHEEECVTKCVVDKAGCAAPAGNVQPAPAKAMPSAKPTAAVLPVQTGEPVQVLEYRYMPMPKN